MSVQALNDQALADQTLKDQILAELNHLSGETLTQVLVYVQSLNPDSASTASTPTIISTAAAAVESIDESPNSPTESAFLKGYQRSKHHRDEVYRRLADS